MFYFTLNFLLGTADGGDESQQGKIWRSLFFKEEHIARRIYFGKSFTPLYYFDPHLDQITLVSIAAVIVLAMERGK